MTDTADLPFRFRFRVRYSECDAQTVVFNARYADYVDIAVNEYIRTLFGDYQNLLARDLDIQVVSLTVNYRAPARFDDVLEARIRAGRLGNTSFTLHLEFVRHGDAQQVAEADITYVLIQPSKMVKAPIPAELRETLEVGAPGVLISHAGE
ncbi:acyl-CoA thioesterase [Marinobacter goseongensis]|jgi:acyl-CoA thioester hydrolase|uniref:acyl-CoA thioesterase n=1 Tax=Marinobacter goseongensis TaxID=453838 RepID=UPI002006D462|nr:thioesterase family protein [Marinobacter goseongensis]MCK7551650.1 acyl-CoA thioesterase [Marinobacter goseongensis]